MLQLKEYQEQCLEQLRCYLKAVGQHGAKAAFVLMTERPYREVPRLPGLPYVCLRVPTGGGKTFMACEALPVVAKEYLHQERAVCLWLVPTKQIAEQTLKALGDREHPYRQALDVAFGGNVEVMDLNEALCVQPSVLEGNASIIVSTLAALRVEDTDGRKIYDQNGALGHHFSGVSHEAKQGLERYEGSDKVIPSLANVLRMWGPVVIMDEAHNARTKLSFETLGRFRPSAIIEFTATPQTEHEPDRGKYGSNILAHVSAAQLKAEDMIKLPIKLHVCLNWREIMADTVRAQHDLEEIANEEEEATGEYIRPIVLLQAQPRRKGHETITADVVKKVLIDDCRVPQEQVAIATGATRGIEDVDLLARGCPIRFIITQQALKEGWDCSFAYIFCSVADIGSARDVEQLLGRVLRLPRAASKRRAELNQAYAMVSSQKSRNTMEGLRESLLDLSNALVANGFQAMEARQFVTHEQPRLPGIGPLFGRTVRLTEPVPEKPNLSGLESSLQDRVHYDEQTGALTVDGPIAASDRDAIERCFSTDAGKQAARRMYDASRGRLVSAQLAQAEPLEVPALSVRVEGELELFEDTHFLDAQWDLSQCDATLTERGFPSEVVSAADGEVDVSNAGRIEARFVQQIRKRLALLRAEPGWTRPGLVNWLDQHIYHPDITRTQSTLFIAKVVEQLAETRGLSADQLARERFRLRNAVQGLIACHRHRMRVQGYQKALFGPQAAELETDPAIFHVIAQARYSPNWYYEGGYQFEKHAIPGMVGELKSEGEEYECAQFIDQLPQVKRWVRNLERRPDASFWLQTSTDRFYPDFVAELNDRRFLVVEYKNERDWSNDDSKEKRTIGQLWEDRSNGRCVFVMPNGKDWTAITAKI